MPCLVASPLRGHDEGDVAVGEGDPHAGADERALPGLEAQSLRGDEIRPRVAGVRISRNVGGDNEDVHSFSHATRVMQKTVSSVRGSAVPYRERLSPSLWVIVSAAVAAPMAALVIAPIDTTLALVVGALVGVAIVVFLIAGSPVVAGEGWRAARRVAPTSTSATPAKSPC